MRLNGLDLNLLAVLRELLVQRSQSLAAARLKVSQGTLHADLIRLRDYFDDELLVPQGREMMLTARGKELLTTVEATVGEIESRICRSPPFDPRLSDRHILIMASDYTTEALLSRALPQLMQQAPKMRFRILPMSDDPHTSLDRRDADLLLTTEERGTKQAPSELLFKDEWLGIGWAKNPAMSGDLTTAEFLSLGRIACAPASAQNPAQPRALAGRRRTEILAPSILSIPSLIVGSTRVAILPSLLARPAANHLPLILKRLPPTVPKINIIVQWHVANSSNHLLRWLIERLAAECRAQPTAPSNVCRLHALQPHAIDGSAAT